VTRVATPMEREPGAEQREIAMEETTKEPAKVGSGGLFDGIAQFAIKTVIVCAAIVVSSIIMLDYLDDYVSRRMEQVEATIKPLTSLGGRQFWTKLERALEQQADPASDVSPEKKRKILAQIKVISDRWRPFLNEAATSIAGESNPPPKQ
jgi:hypothetical protein